MRSDDTDQSVGSELAPDDAAPVQESEMQPASEGAAVDQALAELSAELEALRDKYLRLAAEYDNFRKRTDRERVEARDRYQAQLVEGLLDALDDLRRVADFKAASTSVDALLEGVNLVERKLFKALESAGLELIDPAGQQFDPTQHEALLTGPAESEEDDHTVGQVLQPGYSFRGLLLRPARVEVRKHAG